MEDNKRAKQLAGILTENFDAIDGVIRTEITNPTVGAKDVNDDVEAIDKVAAMGIMEDEELEENNKETAVGQPAPKDETPVQHVPTTPYNESFRMMIRKMVNEEFNEKTNNNEDKAISHILSDSALEYVVPNSFKEQTGEDIDSTSSISFDLLIPKGDPMLNGEDNAEDIKQLYKKTYGGYSYQGPGQSYSKTYYDVKDQGDNFLISVEYVAGLDV